MKEIVLIAPFIDLYKLSNKIIKEKGYKNIEVVLGDLSKGVTQAKKAVKHGASVIISRGGTYTMIKNSVDVPVVEIKMTSFDILRGFKNIINYKGKIGVVGYKNIIDGAEVIKEVLHMDVVKIQIDNQEDAQYKIMPYINNGIKVFVGDTIGNRVTKKSHCVSYIIKSGKESITNAIEEARRLFKITKMEKEKSQSFKTIIDFVDNGIVAIDSEEKIYVFNYMAQKIFDMEEKEVIGKNINLIISNNKLINVVKSGEPEFGEIQEVKKSKIATNRIPIVVDKQIVGAVATFKDITEIQELEKKLRINLSKKGFLAKYTFKDIIYKSKIIKDCIIKAKKYSSFDSPVLITGPSGVGKELFSQSIHNYSERSKGPFVAINCAALPPNLIESELFGYAEGAFTGACKGGKAGLFELAHGGTIFLDEIGEIPLNLQGRLLRVIQEKQVMRIGDDKLIPIDVRIISATNKNLRVMVEKNIFREDLYFRINILFLNIPPLNNRKEDILQIGDFFIKKYSNKYNKNICGISKKAVELLLNYDYRGNVRELEGILERAVILSEDTKLQVEDIIVEDSSFCECIGDNNERSVSVNPNSLYVVYNDKSLEEVKKEYIKFVLDKYNGSVNKTCEVLKIDRSTIWRKIKR
ncbi:sigma 54-interacting transcriptional regulator [Clostridium rectalis]|uniref:sigma 54-interacting transcriptional regulator n=1 Tax=Clostridium rectalis TaxID=2040295 RepID=UPI000F63A2BF|nr:sigma 54-interacting transcriptional regulator [Clostridium rectalis]